MTRGTSLLLCPNMKPVQDAWLVEEVPALNNLPVASILSLELLKADATLLFFLAICWAYGHSRGLRQRAHFERVLGQIIARSSFLNLRITQIVHFEFSNVGRLQGSSRKLFLIPRFFLAVLVRWIVNHYGGGVVLILALALRLAAGIDRRLLTFNH